MLLFWWFFGTFAGIFPAFVAVLVVFWNICGKNSGKCCCFGRFLEHLREFSRHLLLFWWFFGTFAGKTPANVAVLAVLWNICGNFPSVCCCFGRFLEHLPEDCRTFVAVFIGGVRVVKSPEFLVE